MQRIILRDSMLSQEADYEETFYGTDHSAGTCNIRHCGDITVIDIPCVEDTAQEEQFKWRNVNFLYGIFPLSSFE